MTSAIAAPAVRTPPPDVWASLPECAVVLYHGGPGSPSAKLLEEHALSLAKVRMEARTSEHGIAYLYGDPTKSRGGLEPHQSAYLIGFSHALQILGMTRCGHEHGYGIVVPASGP
jgi:hypothetical protein